VDNTVSMLQTHPNHMNAINSVNRAGLIQVEKTLNAGNVSGSGSFEQALLQSMDRVSGMQQTASRLQQEAIINPDSVHAHDVSIAQANANMSLNITRNVLNRLVQGWRDIINTR